MKDRILFTVILFFVFGSMVISNTDSINQTAKSIFNGVGMFVLGLIGIVSVYNYFKKRKSKESF